MVKQNRVKEAYKIFWPKPAPFMTYENFKNLFLDNVLFQKNLYISLHNFVFKLQLCIELAKFNVIEITKLTLLIFALFIKINVNKYDKIIF